MTRSCSPIAFSNAVSSLTSNETPFARGRSSASASADLRVRQATQPRNGRSVSSTQSTRYVFRTNRQLVIRAPHDVLRTRPRNVPTPQQQDLLLLRSLSDDRTQLRPNIIALVQVLPRKLWKDERRPMDIFVPVLAPNQLASRHGFAQLAIFVLGANHEPNLPTRVRRDGRKRVFRLSKNLPGARKEVFDER